MGIFPIMMNILQFWLIDSIVKASTHSTSVALPDDATEDLDPENEPLFHASDTEDDEDSSTRQGVHDVENPPPLARLQSRPSERELSPLNESKLRSSSMPSSASGSNSPHPKTTQAGSQPIEFHAYPPSNTTTPESSLSSHYASSSRGSSRSKRSPPPPLALHPRSPAPIAINSSPRISPVIPHRINDSLDEKRWEAWDENTDDWADRVGEEDWTGKRIENKKATVDNVWAQHTPLHSVPMVRAGSR